jgi:hypothetical protein
MKNYIHDVNPFNLAGPPQWWLQKLWEFDESLVVIPSKQDFVYRMAQRRPPDPKAKLVGDLAQDSDSRMMAQYGLIPVTTINATARWDNPLMWKDLAERCPWRMGGWDKYEAIMDAKEQEQELKKAAVTDDRNTQVAKDGWRYYQKKAGFRSQMYSPTVKEKQDKGRMLSPQVVIK